MPLPTAAIRGIRYRNPSWPDLPLEAVALRAFWGRAPAAFFARPRRPDFHHLVLCTRGEGFQVVDFQRLPLGPGTVLHVRPGQVHAFGWNPDMDGVVLMFAQEALLPGIPADLPALLRPEPDALPRLAAAFQDLLAEYGGTDGGRASFRILQHLLAALLLRLEGPDAQARRRDRPGVFALFEAEVERSFQRSRAVADYARRLGYSGRTLDRACRAAAGCSPKALLSARVLLEAKRLLVHTDWSVARIAVLLGFTEPTNFAKFFRKGAGISPEGFRQREIRPPQPARPGS